MPSFARSVMDSWVMSSPSNRIWPLVGTSTPMMSLASVDLPPPLGPVMTVKRSSGMVSDRSSMMRLGAPSPPAAGTSNVTFLSSNMAVRVSVSPSSI